jgi:hypothetical protein
MGFRKDTPLKPATFYKPRKEYGNSFPTSDVTVDRTHYIEHLRLSPLQVLTKNDESVVDMLRTNNYAGQVIQYVLFNEVRMPTSSGASAAGNNWSFNGIGTALSFTGGTIFMDPTAWWHYGSTTTAGSTSAGATSLTVADGTQVQDMSAGSIKNVLDVYDSSGNTYVTSIYYLGVSGNTVSGIPTSGTGSIGSTIAAGSVVRSRLVSNATSGGLGELLGNPLSTAYRSWIASQYIAYLGSTGSVWDGVFLDNLDVDPHRRDSLSGTRLPYEIADDNAWRSAYQALFSYLRTTVVATPKKLWGNTYHPRINSGTENSSATTQVAAYADAGLDGGMVEEFAVTGSSYYTDTQLDRQLSFIDALTSRGKGVILIAQLGATPLPVDTAKVAFASVAAMLVAGTDVYFRASSYSVSSGYNQWWPNDYYHKRLGQPTAAYQKASTVYTRTFEYGSISVDTSNQANSITFT